MNEEIWKDVKRYGGTFQVSSLGNIRRMKSPTGKCSCKPIKAYKHKNGYVSVALWKNGKRIRHRLHRLVAETFIDNGDKLKIDVHHKNHNRSDNRRENLEWVTPLYNIQNKMPGSKRRQMILMNLLNVLREMDLLRTDRIIDVSEILKKTI